MTMSIQQRNEATVHPSARLSGTLPPSGDKSLSNRIGLLASIGKGISRVEGFLASADCIAVLKAMEALGARTHFDRDGELFIHGTGGKMMPPVGPLDLGNSGTGLRLLTGLLAGSPVTATLTGDASLCRRPMGRIMEPLERMDARIAAQGKGRCAPLQVTGTPLKGITYELPVASAQVKSCCMLAALYAKGTTTIVEPTPTRDHTEHVFQRLGLPFSLEENRITVDGLGPDGPSVPSCNWRIPGDISSAAFWLVAAAAHRRGAVTLERVGLNPRRTAVIEVLKRMGARIKVTTRKQDEKDVEPHGDIRITSSKLKGTVIGGDEIPNLIDELPILAVAGACAEGETVIKDAQELRVKESDRIQSMCHNLLKLGVQVEEMDDGMRIHGPASARPGGVVDSFGDHRVAMAMAVYGLLSEAQVTIKRVDCVETSYPAFWEDLVKLGGQVE